MFGKFGANKQILWWRWNFLDKLAWPNLSISTETLYTILRTSLPFFYLKTTYHDRTCSVGSLAAEWEVMVLIHCVRPILIRVFKKPRNEGTALICSKRLDLCMARMTTLILRSHLQLEMQRWCSHSPLC